jgi:hypothetical protein
LATTRRGFVHEPAWCESWHSSGVPPAAVETDARRGKRVFRYAGSDDERRTRGVVADELQNGDLVVAPAEYGGCDQWGWAPNSTKEVVDMAEEAAIPYATRRFAVRVTPQLIQQFLIDEQRENDQEASTSIDVMRRDLCATFAEHRDEAARELLDAVLDLRSPLWLSGRNSGPSMSAACPETSRYARMRAAVCGLIRRLIVQQAIELRPNLVLFSRWRCDKRRIPPLASPWLSPPLARNGGN